MTPAQTIPALIGSEYDSDHRLVGLAYDSTPPLPTPTVNPWLVAVDGSDNALRAVSHAVGQAEAMRTCSLHLIHVQPWLSKEAAEAELAHRALGATAGARALLDAARLPWRLHIALGDPAQRILEQATHLSVTAIVMGSRGLNGLESLMFGSVAYKVVHRSPVPVTMVP